MKNIKKTELIYLAGIILFFSFLAVSVIKQKSVGFDEAQYPAAGYNCWKNADYKINIENPPLAKLLVSLPLIFFNLDIPVVSEVPVSHPHYHFVFGHKFLAENKISQEKILFLSRIVILLVSIIFGITLYLFTKRHFGVHSAFISAVLYFFCPNILAYSCVATTDLLISFLIFLFVIQFSMTLRHEGSVVCSPAQRGEAISSLRQFLISGLILGLALLTKHTAFVLLPVAAVMILIKYLTEETPEIFTKEKFYDRLVLMMSAAFIVVIAGYRIVHIKEYFQGLNGVLPLITTGLGSGQVYMSGKYSTGGWWYYYIFVFLLKTPIPVILLMISALISIFKRKTLIIYPELTYILPAAAVILVSLSLSKYQIGMRTLLPVYPFLFVWLSEEVGQLWNKKGFGRTLVVVSGVWYIFSAVNIHPHHLAYFNELAGGAKNGSKYLADSNIDWGQDLPLLAKRLKVAGNPQIILSYFGNDSPGHYGIKFQELASRSRITQKGSMISNLADMPEIYLAVSATNLAGAYYPGQENLFWWLKTEKPLDIIGYSIFIYDITHNAIAFAEMGKLYHSQRRFEEAEIMFKQMVKLEPDKKEANLIIARFYKDVGRKDEAKKHLEKVLESDPKNFQAKEELKQL
jgi:hypothetical protein